MRNNLKLGVERAGRRLTFKYGTLWLAALIVLPAGFVRAQPVEKIVQLWPGAAPGAKGTAAADIPGVWIYRPEAQSRPAAVVICPGGGYRVHAVDHEGHQIARWFNRQGITAVVLRYRLGPKYNHPAPLQDAQRAIRYVRRHADQWGLAKDRVGIMGFSAGGHLASTAATHFDAGRPDSDDLIERESSRPDFAILGYPVVSLTADFAHRGSARNLLGADPDPKLLKHLSNETQVTPETPPTFLFHTSEDRGVPPDNSIVFYQACRKAGVPAELHIYSQGPHGVGLANGHPAVGKWQNRLLDWLQCSGLLVRTPRIAVSGTVTYQGEPLRWGSIAFVPEEPGAPTAWAPVRGGKFEIPGHRGASSGKNRVEVYNLGAVLPQPTIKDAHRIDTDNLTAQVGAEMNTFRFELDR